MGDPGFVAIDPGYGLGMGILAWLIIGAIAGGLARLIVPGRDPMGLLATIALGIVGSIVGGFLSRLLFGDADGVGLFGATVGSVIVLILWNKLVVDKQRRGVKGMKNRVMN